MKLASIPFPLRRALKYLLRQAWFTPFLALFICWRIKTLHRAGPNVERPLKLLVLSAERWRQDLETLQRNNDVTLLELSSDLVGAVNAVFIDTPAQWKPGSWNENQISALSRFTNFLQLWSGIDAIVTCSFWYRREQAWGLACERADLPFIAWHKEFTVLEPRLIPQRVKELKAAGHIFRGAHLCCVSDTAHKVFSAAGVFPATRITKVGLLRADNLFKESRDDNSANNRPSIVLFSFGHLTGPFPDVPSRNYYFSRDADFGFVKLFRSVHSTFAEAAQKHPDVDFLIKPKYASPGWHDEIKVAVGECLGVDLETIPNCRIVSTPAPELMRRSLANIVLNSTTVIESRLLDCNTIIPVFEEGAGVHRDMVYFRDFFDLFAIAGSTKELSDLIDAAIRAGNLRRGTAERLQAFLDQQIGNPDGRSGERLLSAVRFVISGERVANRT